MSADGSFKGRLSRTVTIANEDFFSIGKERKSKLLDAVMEVNDTGIALFAPSVIDLKKHESIPLVFLSATTAAQNWKSNLDRNLIFNLFRYEDTKMAPRKWHAWTLIGDCMGGPEVLDVSR